MANVSVTGLPANWKPGDPITTTATNDQNPYTSALIATASAQAEAKRNLDVSQTAAAAYPDNSLYQTQLQINQQQYAATQQAYATAQTNFNSANAPIVALNSQGVDTGINGDTRTIGQTQATPAVTVNDDGAPATTNSPGYGAGTTGNAATSRGDDNNPGLQNPKPGSSNTQQIVSQTFGNGVQNATIIAQPNVLDQYASYTYALSWYLLSPSQYNSFTLSEPFNTTNWKLLMQSGGAPATGRDQYFPIDYYMDDLEIDSLIPMGGTGLPYSAMSLRWKVTEPNGITLIQKLADAVHTLYKNPTAPTNNTTGTGTQSTANQSNQQPNYLAAQHCMVIRFYGYDAQGNLVAPARGQYTTNGQLGGPTQAVITKYYPFVIENITYRVAKSQIEYTVKALPFPHMYNTSTDRGTIPFAYALTGTTVGQILSGTGAPVAKKNDANARSTSTATAPGSVAPIPNQYNVPGWNDLPLDVQMRAQQSWFDTYGRRYNADGTANYGGG